MGATDTWRGVAGGDDGDDVEETVTAGLAGLFRARSRRLLAELLRPHRRALLRVGLLVVVSQAASLAGPLLVRFGIDRGIPPLRPGGSGNPATLLLVVAALGVVAVIQAVTFRAFFFESGRIGEDVVLSLRTRLFDHVGRLSLSFHERFTSGRVISRLTSDVESLGELMQEGLQALVVAALSVVTIGVVLVVLDRPLGLLSLASLPPLFAVSRWYRRRAERAYRAIREAVALVIMFFVESLSGIRAVHAFRREGRNQELFSDLDDRHRRQGGDDDDQDGRVAAAPREQGRDALVDAEAHQEGAGEGRRLGHHDQEAHPQQRPAVRSDQLGEQTPAPGPEQTGQAGGDRLLDVVVIVARGDAPPGVGATHHRSLGVEPTAASPAPPTVKPAGAGPRSETTAR